MLTIQEILRGCQVGRIQTVGLMQVIPLTMDRDLQDDRFELPDILRVGTSHYGTLDFTNPKDKDVLLPSNVGYVVKQAAQDHAMATAGIVPAKRRQSWDNAMCIQETQGGYIGTGEHRLLILPLALRKPALQKRQERSYGKLWPAIKQLTVDAGLGHQSGNLVLFVDGFARQLDQFVAEFELVPRQIGAIVLINGTVVGFERAPSEEYWAAVWEPLIRVCYGSAAVVASRKAHSADEVLSTRVPIKVQDLSSLDALAAELERAEARQDELAKREVRELLDEPFRQEADQRHGGAEVRTIRNDQFYGQVCLDTRSSKILYCSMVVQDGWDERRGWKLADRFTI